MTDPDPLALLPPRVLPRTGVRVARLGLGGAKLGGVFNELNGPTAVALVQEAIDAGITLLDTSNLYAQGESEQIIGTAVAGRRDAVTLVSKAGYVLPGQKRLASRVKGALRPVVHRLGIRRTWVPEAVRGGSLAQDFAGASIVESVEGSLRRLGTDHLDLLLLHSPSREVLEAGTFVDAAQALLDSGKVRGFGISCERLEDLAYALAIPQVSCVQLPLSVLDEQASRDAVLAARQAGVGVMGRQCFASGILLRSDLSTLSGEAAAQAAARRAERMGVAVGAFALGFSVRELDVDTTLVGVSGPGQLAQVLTWAQTLGNSLKSSQQ